MPTSPQMRYYTNFITILGKVINRWKLSHLFHREKMKSAVIFIDLGTVSLTLPMCNNDSQLARWTTANSDTSYDNNTQQHSYLQYVIIHPTATATSTTTIIFMHCSVVSPRQIPQLFPDFFRYFPRRHKYLSNHHVLPSEYCGTIGSPFSACQLYFTHIRFMLCFSISQANLTSQNSPDLSLANLKFSDVSSFSW